MSRANTTRLAHKLLALRLIASLAVMPAFAQAPQQAAQPAAPAQQQAPATKQKPNYVPAPASPANAPQRQKSTVLRFSSDFVRIDVEVTDKSGKPIKGLTADKFSVTDDGKPQNISSFSYFDIESIETAGSSDTDATPIVVPVDNEGPNSPSAEKASEPLQNRRLLVLFFDLTSMQTDDLVRAHDAAQKFVASQMTKADVVSVVAFSTRIIVLANFTNDKTILNKALAQLTPTGENALSSPLYAAAANGEYDVQEYTGAAYTADETEFNVFNTDQKLAAVEGLVNVLGGITGRKAMIEFSGGITQTGEENRAELRAATDAANRANVSIYSIDSRGLLAVPPGGDATTNAATGTSMFTGASVFKQTDQREDSRDTLATLSTDTGGKAFYDLGDLSDAFPKIQADNTGYYLLGYSLGANVKRDGSWRQIHVKVNVAGARVRFRDGYYAPRDFQHLEKEGRDQQLADAINSENPVVDLPVAVETGLFRLSDTQTYVPIAAKISSSALDWAQKHGKRQAEFDFAVDVREAASNRIAAQLRDTTDVNLDPEKFQEVSQKNLLYQGGVVLSPGNYKLKFVARENESGKIGTFEENLAVPGAQTGKMLLSSVLLSSQLVNVQKSTEVQVKGQGARAKLTASPLEMNGQAIVPSVTRFFTPAQTLYVFFQAYAPTAAASPVRASNASSAAAGTTNSASSTPVPVGASAADVRASEASSAVDLNSIRASLIFFRNGLQINATPLLTPTGIDESTHTASFRISLPLSKLPTGRYTVQAIAIAPGTQHSAFARTFLALQSPPPIPSPTNAPPTADTAKP
jgi:VWFA-related protein